MPAEQPGPVLLVRRGDGMAAVPVPSWTSPMALAADLCVLAPPGWHDRTDWCVIEAHETRSARWPDPEPWAGVTVTVPE